jgi:hypothetical protein
MMKHLNRIISALITLKRVASVFLLLTLLIVGLSAQERRAASAQLPSKIPDIPRVKKPKAEPLPKAGGESAPAAAPTAGTSAAGEGQPTVAKDSIQVKAWTNNSYRQNYDVWSWVPSVKFLVNGPIASGSQLYVEYTVPGAAAVQFDCQTGPTQKGHSWQAECGGQAVPKDKSSTYTGPVGFAIKMRNELAGTDSALFNGRMKVAKARTNEAGPKAVNKFVYYVDHDWNLPIGYVFNSPDQVYGWDYPVLNVAFWVRGDAVRFEPHLFYRGQEVGTAYKGGCNPEVENNTTQSVEASLPQKAKWARVRCTFPAVKRWDKTPGGRGNANEMFMLGSNPGEYEFKLLWNNRLARSIKFTVSPEGKYDYTITDANNFYMDRAVVPVQIIGDQDGQWDRAAWKTEAFYGNPLQGFTAP